MVLSNLRSDVSASAPAAVCSLPASGLRHYLLSPDSLPCVAGDGALRADCDGSQIDRRK